MLPFTPVAKPTSGGAGGGGGGDDGDDENDDANMQAQQQPLPTTQRAKVGSDHKLVRIDACMGPGALEKYTVRLDGPGCVCHTCEERNRPPAAAWMRSACQSKARHTAPMYRCTYVADEASRCPTKKIVGYAYANEAAE